MPDLTENFPEESPKNSGTPNVMLMGVGKGGIAIASEIAFPAPSAIKLAFVDTSRSDLDNVSGIDSRKILIGENVLHGFGAGMKIDSGEAAAKSSDEAIRALLSGTDLLFLVTALGHGTGSGASPVIAQIAKELGIMVVCFATNPFLTEGNAFSRQASEAAQKLGESCNAFIAIDHERVAQTAPDSQKFDERFKAGIQWISRGIENCCAMIFSAQIQEQVNFSSFKNIFPVTGTRTLFAIGKGSMAEDGKEALVSLFECPILNAETAAKRSDTLAIHFRLGSKPTMPFIESISQNVQEKFGGKDCILTSFSIIPELGGNMEISVLGASGLELARRHISVPKNGTPLLVNPLSESGNDEEDSLFIGQTRLYEGINLETPTYVRQKINLKRELELRRKKRKKL